MNSPTNSSDGGVHARLVKRFRAEANSEGFRLDIELNAGNGITALWGPSGAGKSLTLNCIAGFVQPDEGRVLIDDRILFDGATRISVPPEKRRCGYLFQDHALFPHMTIRENLRFAASVSPADQNRGLHLRRRINELLETFELTELAGRRPAQLSGGQKQRAALARILLNEPRLLLLDEPTRGLDARLRSAFYELLQKTRERLGVPVILVTHDLDECFELADFVCLMDRGRFLQTGSREQVFSKPASAEIARWLGVYNVIPAAIAALDPVRNTSQLEVLDGQIEGPYLPGRLIGDHGFLCVRGSEIKVSPEDGRKSHHEIILRVIRTTPTSQGVRINLEQNVLVIVNDVEFQSLRDHSRLRLEIPKSAVYFLAN